MLDFSEPAVWWYITRASAVVAWILLTLSALWGILLKTRILRGADNPDWLKAVHRFLSSLALLMVATHMVSLYLDSYIEFTVADLLVPFSTEFEPWGVALGIGAMWIMVIVWLTSLVMDRLPQPLWKGIHFTSYLSLFAVALHSGMVGSDVGEAWYTALSLVLITATTLAGLIRVVISQRSVKSPRTSVAAPSSAGTAVSVSAPAPSALGATRQIGRGFAAKVTTRRQLTDDVVELSFAPLDPATELEWDAGAHITVHLGNGLERQYSLTGDPADQRVLTIAVLNTHGPGGGSDWIHSHLKVGMELQIDGPSQAFPLRPHKRYQFVASGIGITPIRSMLSSLPASRQWTLLYLGRHREEMAYVDELEKEFPGHIDTWISSERGERAHLESLIDSSAHVYACGSESLLEELERIVPASRLHLERFTPVDRSAEHQSETVSLVWEPTGETIEVPPQQTLLEGLEARGIDLNASCRRGVCGSCEVNVLAGVPAHLDSVMSDEDKDELGVMYPCVSRSQTATITVGR